MRPACASLDRCLQGLAVHLPIVRKRAPVVKSRGSGGCLEHAGRQLRCGCGLLHSDGGIREVVYARHERLLLRGPGVVEDDGRRKGWLLRFEVVLEQLLVKEGLRGEVL